jgi:hypothetical protein
MISLQKVISGARVNSLTTMIMEALEQHGGFNYDAIAKELFCFKGNEVSAFQGVGIMVTKHISIKYVPFCIKIHYMVHICNLTFKSTSSLGIIAKIERLLQIIHIYFTHSTKQHLEFNKLVE